MRGCDDTGRFQAHDDELNGVERERGLTTDDASDGAASVYPSNDKYDTAESLDDVAEQGELIASQRSSRSMPLFTRFAALIRRVRRAAPLLCGRIL